jgi:hypothetical protein
LPCFFNEKNNIVYVGYVPDKIQTPKVFL